ncbi:MAG: thiamine pyrophosphate-binding protein [Lentisphaerae bacterium RIFOXYC12_FULL_60_16]|nr:MAG: thiamine pyrophosphate-binding protein [Lentisphaerae bacterium RIFOXYC12_FULL_60_16]
MTDNPLERLLLTGNEALAHAARKAGIRLGSGYPGTPSTEVLQTLDAIGGKAQWSPNEKVAMEVAIGVAFAGARALVTMKHVGLNVAADPLFTVAETGVDGALVVLVADDPGMASSQNEQDSRRYAVAAGIPLIEPSDSQETYDFFGHAVAISERWGIPVLFRMTTRVSHSKSIVRAGALVCEPPRKPSFRRDIPGRVMIPAYARPAHRRLRQKLEQIAAWNESGPLNKILPGTSETGIVAAGIAMMHAREAAPDAPLFKVGMSHPLPVEAIRSFAAPLKRCVVIEEGDPIMVDTCRAAGLTVEGKPEPFRFGELNVNRVLRILNHDTSPETAPPPGRPPQLCPGCPHRTVFEILHKLDCIVSGDIGCYTLGVLPPFQAMDTCVCMGASIGVGLGLRHALPPEQARRVVSVIGDSTFVHSGITGIAEMLYNPPETGHVVLILDNHTTAMTGLQDHPGTGRTLDGEPAHTLFFEDMLRGMGVPDIQVLDAQADPTVFEKLLTERLQRGTLSVIITRKPCLLAARKQRQADPGG